MCEGNYMDASVTLNIEIIIASLPIDQRNGMDVSNLSTKKT